MAGLEPSNEGSIPAGIRSDRTTTGSGTMLRAGRPQRRKSARASVRDAYWDDNFTPALLTSLGQTSTRFPFWT